MGKGARCLLVRVCVCVLNGEGSKMFASTCMCVCSEWGREQDVC